jgi:hypothetical protein
MAIDAWSRELLCHWLGDEEALDWRSLAREDYEVLILVWVRVNLRLQTVRNSGHVGSVHSRCWIT